MKQEPYVCLGSFCLIWITFLFWMVRDNLDPTQSPKDQENLQKISNSRYYVLISIYLNKHQIW